LKNQFKKNLGLFLSLMLIPSAMTGCKTTKPAEVATTNPNEKPVTLTVEVFDRAKPGQAPLDNNYWTKYINDNFGKKYNATVNFVIVPRSQEVDKLNIMMAANQAPDICFTYDQNVVYNYVKQDGLTQLDDLLAKHGQNLTKYLGKDLLSYGTFNGKQMSIPAKRTILATYGSYIRQDWLDKLGMKNPTTKEELYNVLVAFRDKNPGNVTGVIPWGLGGTNYNFTQVLHTSWTKMSEQDFATLPDWQKPGNKEGMQFLNKMYNEKLISPDFAIDKTGKQADADASNGKVGFITANFDFPLRSNPGIYDNLKKNVPTAVFTPVDTFKNYEGKHYKNEYTPNGIYLLIPKASKNAVKAIQYLDWMSDQKTLFFLQNGEEGVSHKLVDGVPELLPLTGDKQINSPSNIDYCLITNGTDLGDPVKNIKAIAKSYPGYEAEATKAINLSKLDTFRYFWFDTPNDANAKYSKTLADKGTEMNAKLLTCKPADFDKLYDSLVQEYMAAGGQAVKDDAIKIYNAMKGKK
jgi:putative aldouronate transport system substrate-binding protein